MRGESLCVLQVISNLDVGGAQEVVRTLAENLEKAGCRSVICAFKDGPLRAEIERLGIPVEILPQRRHSILSLPLFALDMLRLRRALLALVNKHGVDVVQTHLLRSLDFLVLSLRLASSVLVFWTFHNARFELREEHLARHRWSFKMKRWGYRFLYRLCGRWVNRFIAVSENVKTSMLESLPGIPEGRIITVCNSVEASRYGDRARRDDLRRELGLGEDDRIAAVVATLKEQKGHRFLLNALPKVVKQYPDLKVLFIGDGELRDALQSRTLGLGLENYVHFLGNRSDVPALLAASDYFILPSLWEGLPMALAEAMASGLPVIATRVSGTSQVMIHAETGLLVPPGNSDELSFAMLKLLSNPVRATEMGAAARRRVEVHFSAQAQAREYVALFTQELNPRKTSAKADPSYQGDRV